MNKLILLYSIVFCFQVAAQTIPNEYMELFDNVEMSPYEEKFKILDQAIQDNPNEPWFYWMTATVYDMQGNDEKVLENYNKALALDSNFSGGHASLSRFLRYNEEDTANMKKALFHINKAIELEPDDDYYRIDKGYILLALEEFDLAEKEADYTLGLPDFDVMAAEQLKIEILEKSGKREELKAFVKVHDLSNDGEFLGTQFCLMLAALYEEMGDLTRACKLYRGAAEPYLMMDEKIPAFISSKLEMCQ